MSVDYRGELIEQLDWHWRTFLRPRFGEIADDEYTWLPPMSGTVTTIAWRLHHIGGSVLGWRVAAHVTHTATSHAEHIARVPIPPTAAEGLALVDTQYALWMDALRAKDDAGFAAPCGPAEGPYADAPFASLVLHINREVIHHGAEILLLQDLYAAR